MMSDKKRCSKCGEEKERGEFSKDKKRKDGLQCSCKECYKLYASKNKDKIKEYQKQYIQENKNILYTKRKQYYKQRYIDNKERITIQNKQWRSSNRDKVNYRQNERRKNICNRIRDSVSSSIGFYLRKNNIFKQNSSKLKYLSYSIQDLKRHLENQFEDWMSWENYGRYEKDKLKWNIDHIIPHNSFYYETLDCEEFKKCWALENLRPLEISKNSSKGDRLDFETDMSKKGE